MEAAWHRRLLWRRRGAWMWPAFVAFTVIDAVIGHGLPPSGTSEQLFAAGLAGLVLNVLGLVLLSRPLSALVRRVRPDLPVIVARDYAGTTIVSVIALLFLTVGLVHHATVVSDEHAQRDAISRAQAFIGDRAPAEFRRNVQWISTFAIQPGSIYRACVPSANGRRTYCVIVDTSQPFPGGVRFGGYEPNSSFSLGVN